MLCKVRYSSFFLWCHISTIFLPYPSFPLRSSRSVTFCSLLAIELRWIKTPCSNITAAANLLGLMHHKSLIVRSQLQPHAGDAAAGEGGGGGGRAVGPFPGTLQNPMTGRRIALGGRRRFLNNLPRAACGLLAPDLLDDPL